MPVAGDKWRLALRARRAGGEPKPPGAAAAKSRRGKRPGKGPARLDQVSDEKTNMCEPLLTHRKTSNRHQNPGLDSSRGQRPALWCALSQGAACVWPWRCPV
jgi:hypothetical protein